jgi:cysteine-rich repeat protein
MGSGATGGTFPGTGGSAGGGGWPLGECGDGVWDWNEQCDDGNVNEGDGCDPGCVLEAGYNCDDPSAGCHPVICGDGTQEGFGNGDGTYGYESCDDGNPAAGDGCSDVCQQEPGFTCPDGPGVPCREVVCGDGFQDGYFLPGSGGTGGTGGSGTGGTFAAGAGGTGGFVSYFYEQCDDGNATSADGCSSTCTVEPGYVCDAPNTGCRIPVCGDGWQDFIATGGTGSGAGGTGSGTGSGTGGSSGMGGMGPDGTWESCDDGNTVGDDGCSNTCELEPGWICDRLAEPCRQPRCGDGFIDFIGSGGTGGTSGGTGGGGGQPGGSYEQCDDGNEANDDGCSSSCAAEDGWACQTAGEPCHLAVCGDGIVDWPVEDCDDGNEVSSDGCNDCRYDFGGVGGSFGAGGMGSGGTGGSGG